MANCPECGKAMVKKESEKKKGFFVLKHENPEDQKNCGVKFVPVGASGAKKEAGATEEDYGKAVKKSKRAAAKSGNTSGGSSTAAATSSGAGEPAGSGGGPVQKSSGDSGRGKLKSEYPYYE